MFVAVSSRCFPDLSLEKSIERLADLEYTALEVVVGNEKSDLSPEILATDPELAARKCLVNRQIRPVAFFLDLETSSPGFMKVFENCCRLSKLLRVVTISIRSSRLGTPYNEEIERLRKLVRAARLEGVTIGLLNETGRISESVESINSLCNSVPGLALTLDPSYFIYEHKVPIDYEGICHYACHLRLRDTTQTKFQIQIGQGVQEYGKLFVQLSKSYYNRALCVDLAPLPDLSQESELRKMRLLLESILS